MISDPTLLALAQRNRRRRELKERTTPGPWVNDNGYRVRAPESHYADECGAVILETKHFSASTGRDCEFIAEARNDPVEDDIDLLLAEVRRLRREVTQ